MAEVLVDHHRGPQRQAGLALPQPGVRVARPGFTACNHLTMDDDVRRPAGLPIACTLGASDGAARMARWRTLSDARLDVRHEPREVIVRCFRAVSLWWQLAGRGRNVLGRSVACSGLRPGDTHLETHGRRAPDAMRRRPCHRGSWCGPRRCAERGRASRRSRRARVRVRGVWRLHARARWRRMP
jgi:hypothetical protein